MITNQITITNYTTNFITNYLTNITEITNVGLNDNTISIITNKSVIDMLSLIGSIIIPLIAFIYSIWLNNKLNKINELKFIIDRKRIQTIVNKSPNFFYKWNVVF